MFSGLPPERRQPAIDLIYVTDREPNTEPGSPLPYGAERSRELAFGTATVEMGPSLDWTELENQSRLGDRTVPVTLTLGEVTELGRFPPTPYKMRATAEGLVYDPDVLESRNRAKAEFLTVLEEHLRETTRKDVVVYVHGFNETFETAMFTLAELCHFLGREFACVLFSWPAGSGGNLLTGYGRERESSEFGMFHLKKMIRVVGESPQVEELHLLAHSRGTDVLLTAMRELAIESHSAGVLASRSKIRNVVLMAPDVDHDVATQRIAPIASDPDIATSSGQSTKILPGDLHVTVYVSPGDRALRASAVLFRSKRVGLFSIESMSAELADFWKTVGYLHVVQVPASRTDLFGHGYFTTNPTVSSDLISLLRYDRQPGDPERVLEAVIPPILWRLETP